jgi:hypothetical protein
MEIKENLDVPEIFHVDKCNHKNIYSSNIGYLIKGEIFYRGKL